MFPCTSDYETLISNVPFAEKPVISTRLKESAQIINANLDRDGLPLSKPVQYLITSLSLD